MMRPALIVHGGAWDWSDSLDEPKRESLRRSLSIGWEILNAGGTALTAVEKAVNCLEDDPLFDAGTGSHLNAEGLVEMDALLIDAQRHDFGAVAGVQRVRYPISLARKVLEETEQNFFVGAGADALAQRVGIEWVPNLSLVSQHELDVFQQRDTSGTADTVGAVAIDAEGNIAVATSTGGTPLKPAGRVGDSPLFGAGGYAHNDFGGASATGQGEHSMRVLLSKHVVDQIAAGHTAQSAAIASLTYVEGVIADSMLGVIVIDKQGRVGAAHTTPKLAHGWIDADDTPQVRMRSDVVVPTRD
jgi:L-asparaginase / beta-aspartyl-peptidase